MDLVPIRRSACVAAVLMFLFSCSYSPEKDFESRHPKQTDSAFVIHTVEIKDMKFTPDTVAVNKGDRIVFVNRDLVAHCVTETGNAWTSGAIPGGESYTHIADSSANYYCAIHKVMKGTITVKP